MFGDLAEDMEAQLLEQLLESKMSSREEARPWMILVLLIQRMPSAPDGFFPRETLEHLVVLY